MAQNTSMLQRAHFALRVCTLLLSFRVGGRRPGIEATLLYVAMLPVVEGDYTDKAQPS